MKYIKTFEKKSSDQHLFAVENNEVEELYEYFYNLGCNPIVYKIPEKIGKFINNKDYMICYTGRKKVDNYIFNRSYSVTPSELETFEIDEVKEKDMKQFIDQLKYNL